MFETKNQLRALKEYADALEKRIKTLETRQYQIIDDMTDLGSREFLHHKEMRKQLEQKQKTSKKSTQLTRAKI